MTYSYDNINKNKLLNKIKTDKNSSNLGVTTQCIKVFASTEELKSNYGFFSLLIILIIFIIIFIIFCIKGKELLKNKIDEVIYNKFEKNKKQKKKKKVLNNNINNSNNYNNKKRKEKKNKSIPMKKSNSNIILKENKNSKKGNKITDNSENNKNIVNVPDNENDYEMNTLSYMEALKYDKRSCCEYYTSLIKNKQLFIITFCSFNDYNS